MKLDLPAKEEKALKSSFWKVFPERVDDKGNETKKENEAEGLEDERPMPRLHE